MQFIHTLLSILYAIGALPTIGGIIVLAILEPRPVRVIDHLRCIARYLILGGTALYLARVIGGHPPRWEVTALVLGLGFAIAAHARENHLLAKLQEKLEADAGQESGA